MVNIIVKSEIGQALDTGFLNDFLASQTLMHEDLLAGFSNFLDQGAISLVSLSSSKIVFDGTYASPFSGVYSYEITITGSGLSPVSSLAALEAAFEAGLANGDFSDITITGSKAPQFPGDTGIPEADILNLALTSSGYTMTSGNQVIKVVGTVPTGLDQFFELGQTANQLSIFESLSTVQQAAVIADLNAYDFESFSLESGGVEVFSFDSSATSISLTVMGYKVALIGTFPGNIGDELSLLLDISDALDAGQPLDFSGASGFSVTKLKVTNSDGDVILKTMGALGSSDTISLGTGKIDGVNVTNLMMGENTSNELGGFNYQPGDFLNGTSGIDHMFGLSGHDTLNGGRGADYLFGGTGDDVLNGGNGNDFLNAGDNRNWDRVLGSKGNDTISFSENVGGFQQIEYNVTNLSGGIDAVIDAKANTGSIKKGGFGTDTLVDVAKATGAVLLFPATGGLGLVGTAYDDTYDLKNSKGGWMSVRGGDGVDDYTLRLTGNSITRINFWDGQNGIDINVKNNIINDDGFGNIETLNTIRSGGVLEIHGSNFADRLIGSIADERFILRSGADYADGKGGTDLIRYDRYGVESVNVNLSTETATGTWGGVAFTHTLKNFEDIRGSRDADDTLIGNAKANTIEGRGGNDTIVGKAGRDILLGEDGNDTLSGGKGVDKLTGGAGDDRLTGGGNKDFFIFNADLDEGKDTILDFRDGLDIIRIEGAEFDDLTIKKTGGGAHTKIVLDSGTEIILKNIEKSDISADDFDFI